MNQTETAVLPPARRANDYFMKHKRFREPEMLFDEFWREGELALFFGAAGTGKSIFAVQLADALSRGRGLEGFRLPRGRRRVLYVDLRHTDEQFLMRCANRRMYGGRRRPHRFPRNLLRDRPPQGEDLCEWLRSCVAENGVQVVIVDDLSAVKNTHDGTRETLRMMRRLRSLRDELGISILVLAESGEPPRQGAVGEADLGRSRVLCTAADSVFAAGRGRERDGDHYFMQTRAGSARPLWQWKNAPVAELSRTSTGLLSFEFDERFGRKMTEEKRRLICEIARLRDSGEMTFREIAGQLGISKTWAADLYHKWTPALECGMLNAECGIADEEEDDEEWDAVECGMQNAECGMENKEAVECGTRNAECGVENEEGEADRGMPRTGCGGEKGDHDDDDEVVTGTGTGKTEAIPQSAFRTPHLDRSIYDLPRDRDGYGDEIYIESRCEHSGKPAVWYKIDKKGTTRRSTRGPLGIRVEVLDTGPFL